MEVIQDEVKINQIDEIDRKIAELIKQKKQCGSNQTKYEEFIKNYADDKIHLAYYCVDDVHVFRLLCKNYPRQYDGYLMIKRALKNKNLPLIGEIVLQGYKLYKISSNQISISELYYDIIKLCMELGDLNVLKVFHENLTINAVMDMRVEIFDKSRETYYEIVKPYCNEKHLLKINEYKVKTQNDQNQLHSLKNSKCGRFTKYMEMITYFDGYVFDWVIDGFRKYCNFDQIYQNGNKIHEKLMDYTEYLIKDCKPTPLRHFNQIFNLFKLYEISSRPGICDQLKISAAKFGLEYYRIVTDMLGDFTSYYEFPKFMFDIDVEVFKYMFKNLNWKSFSNPQVWDSYKDSFYNLILLAEEKNNKPILDFLLQFRYP
jgi:hypothetical protein